MNNYNKLANQVLQLKKLLVQIYEIENDLQMHVSDKFSQIKIIRDEIQKVAQQIDMIKKEIKLERVKNIN
jgi:hypothetical protein